MRYRIENQERLFQCDYFTSSCTSGATFSLPLHCIACRIAIHAVRLCRQHPIRRNMRLGSGGFRLRFGCGPSLALVSWKKVWDDALINLRKGCLLRKL